MTTANTMSEFKQGDNVVIKVGAHAGKSAKITKVAATQNTLMGTETRFGYKTSVSAEWYRAQDLQKG